MDDVLIILYKYVTNYSFVKYVYVLNIQIKKIMLILIEVLNCHLFVC